MAVIRPFRALRPQPERAQQVASVPYDVVNTDEARALADRKSIQLPARVATRNRSCRRAQTFTATPFIEKQSRISKN